MIILFYVILKDVDNLYKWQTFWPKRLHQSQMTVWSPAYTQLVPIAPQMGWVISR